MRILRITASARPEVGGPLEGIYRSSEIMAGWGCRNEVLTTDAPGEHWIKDAPLPIHAVGRSAPRYNYSPALTRWLLENIQTYDAAIIHGIWNYASLGAWRALRRRSVPYFLFPHGMLDPWFLKAQPKGLVRRAYWSLFESRVLTDATRVLFTNEEERRLARETYGGGWRDAVVAYGTAPPPPPTAAQVEAFTARTAGLRGRPYLLFLGRIHPKKGCDLLLEAFASLCNESPDLDLVIAGPDQVGWKAELAERAKALLIEDRVHWPGMLEGDAKWGAFRGAEAFVLPSHQENFGISVAEAMACARPVLITRAVNIWPEVEASGGGVATLDNQEDVTHMLRDFLSMPAPARAEMGLAAERCFRERFEITQSARDILSHIEAAVRERQTGLAPEQHSGTSRSRAAA